MVRSNFENSEKNRGEEFVHHVRWELPSDVNVLNLNGTEFRLLLSRAGWDTDSVESMALGLHEALINAIVHGNLGIHEKERAEVEAARQNKKAVGLKVFVDLSIGPDEVTVIIRDEGQGFDWHAQHDPTDEKNLMQTTGRGRLLMQAFFDEVTYNEKGNEVTLIKHRKQT